MHWIESRRPTALAGRLSIDTSKTERFHLILTSFLLIAVHSAEGPDDMPVSIPSKEVVC